MKITMRPLVLKSKRFNSARYKNEIDVIKKEVAQGILKDFQKTTATWQHKFKFGSTRRGNAYFIGTKDKIYGYVDRGTKPHVIRAKKPGGRLAFYATGFRAKTKVDTIGSEAGRAADSDFTRPKAVHHPGTEARNFSKRIKEKWQKEWLKEMNAALRRAAGG